MPKYYQIPTHLRVADKIDVPILGWTVSVTIRQGLIGLLGGSVTVNVWKHLAVLSAFGPAGAFLHVALTALLAVVTFLVATMSIAGRHLEEWAALLLIYYRRPRVYIWRQEREQGHAWTSAGEELAGQQPEEESEG